MLIGEYNHTIDTKGRIFIPSKFREDMGDTFIITRGIGNCLFGLSHQEWASFSEKLRTLPMTDAHALNFTRLFFAGATECDMDKQGRILIPANLRSSANLEKDAVVIGMMNRIEIWDKNNWADFNKQADSQFEDTLLKMSQLGI
jgi:MraZ protein